MTQLFPAKPSAPKDVEPGFDAKSSYITKSLETLFINVKHYPDSPDRYEFDPRASTSDIDNMLAILNSERKRIKRRELQNRAEMAVKQRERLESSFA